MTDQTKPGAVKPGVTTTEFWVNLLGLLIAAAVAIGSIFKSNFNLDGVQAVVPAIAVLAAALAQAFYSHSRAVVKAAAQNSAALAERVQAATPAVDAAEIDKAKVESNGSTQRLSANSAPQPSITLTGFQFAKD